jgi:23S rRNA (uracil1939-C5)-methyltransferase
VNAGEHEVVVEALGAAGDGIALVAGRRVFVPGALPGERWRIRLGPVGDRALTLECLAAVARAVPPCRHFGRCGGCRLQHLTPAEYAAFKHRRVVEALARHGLPTDIVDAVRIGPPASRRRLRLALKRGRTRPLLGLRERAGQGIVPLEMCAIADPALVALLAPLGGALAEWLTGPPPAEASLALTDGGPDLLLHAARPAQAGERAGAAALARQLGLARIAWQEAGAAPEALVSLRPPLVQLSGVPVELPPGAFLQATAFGEAELARAVTAWGEGARTAADLYAGIGTLTLALAGRVRRLLACEGDPAAVAALRRAAAGRNVTVVERDLVRRPLQPADLDQDLVVLDPPRAGAAAQCAALARSPVPRVIYASCQPESFASDARTLVDAGFALVEVRPIDQFLYSAEIELVALLTRPTSRRRT